MSTPLVRRLVFVLLLVAIVGVEGALFANLPAASPAQDNSVWALISRVTSMRESLSLVLLGAFLVLAASQLRRRLEIRRGGL